MSGFSSATRPARLLLPAALAATALLLTACSGDTPAPTSYDESPLATYTNGLWDGEELTQEQIVKQQTEHEELIAQCMTNEGFEYTPVINTGVETNAESEVEAPDWGTDEFVKQYGYGIADNPFVQVMAERPEPEEFVDPNTAYVDSLSDTERAAYWEALTGPELTDEELAALEEGDGNAEAGYDWKTSGCDGFARHETGQDYDPYVAASEDPQYADLFTQMQTIWAGVYDDEKPHEDVAELNRTWAECMTEAGQEDYASPNVALQALEAEYRSIERPATADGRYQGPLKADKEKFQEREFEVSLADAECKKAVKYNDSLTQILFALEQEFVDEHKTMLDAMVAQYGSESAARGSADG
ncbi:hypothetical protein ACXR2T_02850 [Leucobacter sp. HY1910]